MNFKYYINFYLKNVNFDFFKSKNIKNMLSHTEIIKHNSDQLIFYELNKF